MLFGVGCTPDGGTEADSELAKISVSPTSFATSLEGGEQVIAVTSNGTWAVSCDQADVVVEPLTGNGNGSVTITVPAADAAREFEVVFNVQKQTTVPALGQTTTTTDDAKVTVSQNAGGIDQNNFLYYEKCGTDAEEGEKGWPYVDQFTGWTPEGPAATNVTYTGQSASVRCSGQKYQPTEDAVGVSGQPYVFLNKIPASAYFVIENIAVTGGTNYTVHFNVSCQNGYNPLTFAEVDNSLVHLELGYDGESWDAVDCTFAPNGGNGWYAANCEFKVKADATTLYARFTYEAPTSNGGGRFDDFKLVEGGNGDELVVVEKPIDQGGDGTAEVEIPYAESFATAIGDKFSINNVELGGLKFVWIQDPTYGCMKASGYNNAPVATESWLISPNINLTSATEPELKFEHCHKFAGTLTEELTLWISTDGGNNWTPIEIPTYGTNNDYNFVKNTISLKAYAGQKVKIAFKYLSSTAYAGTWEVRNFSVAEKVEEKPVEVVAGSYHKLTAAPADWTGKYLIVWDGNAHATVSGKDLIATASGLAIANDAVVNDATVNAAAVTIAAEGSNFSVKLPSNDYLSCLKNSCSTSAVAFKWNIEYTANGVKLSSVEPDASNSNAIYILYKNAGGPYYRCYVEKSQSDYVLPTLYKFYAEGETPEQPGTPEPTPSVKTLPYAESFNASQGDFTIDNVELGGLNGFVWGHKTYNNSGYMNATAYVSSTRYATESWLVSPEVSLAGATAPELTFEHTHKYAGTAENELTLWVKESNATDWTQVVIPTYGTNTDWNWVTATVDLSAYAGKTIKFAYKYTSTTSTAATWEIRNVNVAEKSSTVTPEPEPEQPGTPETPETPDTPATGDYTKIEKVANLVAGDYIVAGYLTTYTSGSNTYDWTNYPYHFWTGTISSKNDLNTVNGNESMVLDPNMSAQDAAKGQPATITFVAVDGKTNTYYIKVGDKYLYNKTSATNRSLGLGDTQVEWVVSDHSKGGLVLATDGVQAATAGATYDLIRSYKDSSAGSSLKYGLVFFKKN